MPLEWGIFLGIKRSEPGRSSKKTGLIFVKDNRNLSFKRVFEKFYLGASRLTGCFRPAMRKFMTVR
jgi:hypothetical protein